MHEFKIIVFILIFFLQFAFASDSESIFSRGKISSLVTNAAETFTGYYSANDYFCGSVNVMLVEGWEITSVKVTNGSIQNQFQFKQSRIDRSIFRPNGYSTNLLQIRQLTGYVSMANIYWSANPIDFTLSMKHKKSAQVLQFRIQKEVCSLSRVGSVLVEQLTSENVRWLIKNSVLDDQGRRVGWAHNAFFTPAYVIIPSPKKWPGLGSMPN
ncbi:hypothetical protein [Endozoicomonas numazuensis]|uniref:Uncharacterized protein n=1 Tax=Endozoicomonas numazuensis TaxID=1137799 RepID=A0A081NM59_9GAMM|nr:hypothetical protein [Endozoicomonas numazuensis]KEQ19532.1 hypothetical protein GZ78_06345 [Endozoicomonas numazuensis]